MKRYLCYLAVAVTLFSSCKTKQIASGTIVYRFEQHTPAGGAPENQLVAYKVTSNTADFTPTADNLIILDGSTVTIDTNYKVIPLHLSALPSLQGKTLDSYFFGDVAGIKAAALKADIGNPKNFPVAKSLSYTDGGLILQALSVPYKIRSKLSGADFPTPIQSTVETGFSANISLGYKFAKNWFKPNKDVLGLNLSSVSVTPGLFAGLGTVGLTATNTLGAPTVPARTALLNSYGYFVLIGVGRIGFGYAGGWDHANGDNSEYWVYKGKYWNGFAVSIDLIKF